MKLYLILPIILSTSDCITRKKIKIQSYILSCDGALFFFQIILLSLFIQVPFTIKRFVLVLSSWLLERARSRSFKINFCWYIYALYCHENISVGYYIGHSLSLSVQSSTLNSRSSRTQRAIHKRVCSQNRISFTTFETRNHSITSDMSNIFSLEF